MDTGVSEPTALFDVYVADDEPFDDVNVRLYRAGLTDGLPIVPPTLGRIRGMYGGAHLDPAEYVGTLEPALRPISVYELAVCAVMAGCEPAHLPVLRAAVQAMGETAFNLLGIQTTTGSATPILIVNGPIAAAAGINAAANCLGPGVRANAAIGRAVRLVLQNLGGARAGGMDMATMGQPAKFGLCFAENEDRSPWEPLHVERGFRAQDSVVTVAGISGTVEVVHASSIEPDEVLATVAGSMTIAGNVGGAGMLGGGEPLVVLSYEHAQAIAAAGWSKADAKRYLFGRATLAAPTSPNRVLRVAARAEDIMIVVAGGVGVKSTYMPTWGGGTRAQSAVMKSVGR
jgi:hypothetical protein